MKRKSHRLHLLSEVVPTACRFCRASSYISIVFIICQFACIFTAKAIQGSILLYYESEASRKLRNRGVEGQRNVDRKRELGIIICNKAPRQAVGQKFRNLVLSTEKRRFQLSGVFCLF